jgi:hypothetical protein
VLWSVVSGRLVVVVIESEEFDASQQGEAAE